MRLVTSAFVLFFLCVTPVIAQDVYKLNPGDQVYVEVWNEPDLQRTAIILPDGMLSFPLAGQVMAAGLTLQQLQDSITERLGGYITSPVVTVSISEMTGNTIYVIGQVNAPGSFTMRGPMSALQALSLSGGFTTFADTKRIRVIRRSPDGEQVLRINYDELSSGSNLESNHDLFSGDVIVVP